MTQSTQSTQSKDDIIEKVFTFKIKMTREDWNKYGVLQVLEDLTDQVSEYLDVAALFSAEVMEYMVHDAPI